MRQVPLNQVIQNSTDHRNSLRALFTITFLDHISLNIGVPVLTFLCFDAHSTLFATNSSQTLRASWYGILSAMPHFVAILAAPFLAWLSDYFGRKKILLIGALGAFFLCLFTALSIWFGNILLLLVGAIIAGFCTRTEPVALAVVGDRSTALNRLVNMGYLQFYIAVGAFLGPLFGGFLAQLFFATFNFSLPYVVGTLVAVVTLFITWYKFHDIYPSHFVSIARKSVAIRSEKKYLWRELHRLLNPTVFQLSLVLVLTQICWRLYYQFMPPVLKISLHYTPSQIGMFIALLAICLAIASWLGIRFLSIYFDIHNILRLACWAMGIGIVLTIIACFLPLLHAKQILIWSSMFPIAMGDVIVYSVLTTLYSEAVTAKDQGKIMGMNYIIVSVVWAITGLLGGYLMSININLPLVVAVLPLLCLGAIDISRIIPPKVSSSN